MTEDRIDDLAKGADEMSLDEFSGWMNPTLDQYSGETEQCSRDMMAGVPKMVKKEERKGKAWTGDEPFVSNKSGEGEDSAQSGHHHNRNRRVLRVR